MKKKKNSIIASVGDIFAIPIGENKHGYGQIVGEGYTKTYVIYDIVSEAHPELNKITSSKIIFLTHTVDVPIEDGDWILLGNAEIPTNINFPKYKVDTPDGYYVTDYRGELISPASEEEISNLGTRKSISPSILEDAVKAKYGFGEWYKYLDNLIYNN